MSIAEIFEGHKGVQTGISVHSPKGHMDVLILPVFDGGRFLSGKFPSWQLRSTPQIPAPPFRSKPTFRQPQHKAFFSVKTIMPTVPIYSKSELQITDDASNPLPDLLKTPSGLAILELQGTINLPSHASTGKDDFDSDESDLRPKSHYQTPIGRLVFPDYDSSKPPENTSWMKRVYLYVGQHQRLTGEVKKLSKPLAIIRQRQRRDTGKGGPTVEPGTEHVPPRLDEGTHEELEIAEIIRYKMLFSTRPEPVSDSIG
ncbi:conserved hypothetical protein [Uncinocarpus reesii 1704]|uniref:Chromosome transmission fidelity protein 8 n=1 Tax=Uncinocarpus reesii (strain UAMH 1704) TaxID=336963 RepID=C4JRP0_UNCRE|nr:uncharacterized protein UREG_05129 [Uncinocarpus reesii 1704]EEP80287.1 conserved hypothetical protein [Uncinocarpus reesii 1704]